MCFLSYAETTFKRQRQAGRYKHTENETETEGGRGLSIRDHERSRDLQLWRDKNAGEKTN